MIMTTKITKLYSSEVASISHGRPSLERPIRHEACKLSPTNRYMICLMSWSIYVMDLRRKVSWTTTFIGQFSAPAELSVGGANNTDNAGGSDSAGVGKFSFLSGSVTAAAIVTGLSLCKFQTLSLCKVQ